MGGPLFVWGWFILWMGISCVPMNVSKHDIYPDIPHRAYLPLFLNWRTSLSFFAGCGMIPVVGFLDYAHDLNAMWLGENDEGRVFTNWHLGTNGAHFGLFLESPWPFVMMFGLFGAASFLSYDDEIKGGVREIILVVNCILQGVVAGILIQQNLYAGNMAGKKMYSLPFALLFVTLAFNIGSRWDWHALLFSLPGAMLIILGQKTVFGARRRGDYTMQNGGEANPYDRVFVYNWGEVFFMMGWILICWAMSLPTQPGEGAYTQI